MWIVWPLLIFTLSVYTISLRLQNFLLKIIWIKLARRIRFSWLGLPHQIVSFQIQVGGAGFQREDISSSLITFKDNDQNMNHLYLEINLEKKNRLIPCSHNPYLQFIHNLTRVRKRFDVRVDIRYLPLIKQTT